MRARGICRFLVNVATLNMNGAVLKILAGRRHVGSPGARRRTLRSTAKLGAGSSY
jgi:hypothetical protein